MNYVVVPEAAVQANGQITLADSNVCKHINQVLKLEVGDQLKIAIENQCLAVATIAQLSDTVMCLANVNNKTAPPAKMPCTMVLALPRPKVFRRLIIDMTAQGVSHIVLLHSFGVDKSYWQTPHLANVHNYVREGMAQAGDCVPPRISIYQRFKPFVQDVLPTLLTQEPTSAWVLHPYSSSELPRQSEQPTLLMVGPERGFIPYEIDLLASVGVQAVHLGHQRLLRTEAVVNSVLGRLY